MSINKITAKESLSLFMFVVPRLHTNMLGWLEGLQKLGIQYTILVRKKSSSEDYSLGEPQLIDPNVKEYKIHFYDLFLLHRLFVLKEIIKVHNPSLIILRLEMDFTSFIMLFNVILSKKPFAVYQQWPILGLSSIKKIVRHVLMSLLGVPFFSPVLSKKNEWIGHYDFESENFRIPRFIPFAVQTHSHVHEKVNFAHAEGLKFVTVGKFQRRKNHLKAIEALINNPRFAETNSSLDLFGEVSSQEHQEELLQLLRQIEDWKVQDKVFIHINVDHKRLLNYLRDFDIFFMLSESEPASISNIEAMSFGLPVIIFQGNGTGNYLQNGYGGFIVSSFSEFSDKISFFLDNPSVLSDFSQNNLNSVRNFNSPIEVAKQISNLSELS